MTNILGDVISIIDSTGTSVVEYIYDAWGKLVSTTGCPVHFKNPIGSIIQQIYPLLIPIKME